MPASVGSVIWLVSCLFIFLMQENRFWTGMTDQKDWRRKICPLVLNNALNIITNGKVKKSIVAYQKQILPDTGLRPLLLKLWNTQGWVCMSGYGGADRQRDSKRGAVWMYHRAGVSVNAEGQNLLNLFSFGIHS